MKILNTEKEDYHVHSTNFSDGFNTIDEIAIHAKKFGLKKIIITDHSDETMKKYNMTKRTFRQIIGRWKNIHNNVDISFGVEADLINEKGDVNFHIQGVESPFVILSYHDDVYSGNSKKAGEGFCKAIERFHDKINIIGHVCLTLENEDILKVIQTANKHKVPLELNAKYFLGRPESWRILMDNAEQLYINSDAHTLWELKTRRKDARAKLKEMGYAIK